MTNFKKIVRVWKNQMTIILFKIWPTNRFSKAKSYNFYFHKNDVTWPLNANGLLRETPKLTTSSFDRSGRELKPVSNMQPTYLQGSRRYRLGYFPDEWERAPPATRAIAELYRWHACAVELEFSQLIKNNLLNRWGSPKWFTQICLVADGPYFFHPRKGSTPI